MKILSYLIAEIPLQPDDNDKKPLILNYNSQSEQGFFCYGDRKLQLTSTYEETIITNSFPTGRMTKDTQPMQMEISCSTWVNYFSDWQIDVDNLYFGCGKLDFESDTGRQVRYFSGFKFDSTKAIWECSWEKRDIQDVYNTTFEHSWKIEIIFNLLESTGHYTEYKYTNYT